MTSSAERFTAAERFTPVEGELREQPVREMVTRLNELFPKDDPTDLEAHLMVGRTWAALSQLVNRHFGSFGLTGHQLGALRLLTLADRHRLTIKDIMAFFAAASPNTTKLVDRLEKSGIVRRVQDSQDRRVTWVELTPTGEALYRAIHPGTNAIHEASFSVLSSDEKLLLIQLLTKVRKQALALADGILPGEAED